MSKSKPDRKRPSRPEGPPCPFCGRRVAVRRIEGRVHHCRHCDKMFQL